MVIISAREFRDKQKKYFDLATEEQVLIKRGKDYFYLIANEKPDTKHAMVSDEWMKEFFSIPAEYRCNPFECSPSGDLFFADRRNLEHIKNAKEGQIRTLSKEDQKKLLSFD
ncbi:MAG: hypothetical protein LBH77_01300 [Tannerella sp.]|jgi:hypothetical protein|nr:hypothetical protein [Tannerella sp.]